LNDALFLERADTAGDRRRRKRNALGKLDLAQAAILDQGSENRTIQRVYGNFFNFPAPITDLAPVFYIIARFG